MWISNLKLENIKSFHKLDIELAKNINIFVGANNSGKSTILQSIYLLQEPKALELEDLRKYENKGLVSYKPNFDQADSTTTNFIPYRSQDVSSFNIEFEKHAKGARIERKIYKTPQEVLREGVGAAKTTRPDNLIYTHLSNRKVTTYDKATGSEHTEKIFSNHACLPVMVDNVIGRRYPKREAFEISCESILGFLPDSFNIPGGKGIGIQLDERGNYITIDKMGQGVPSILALIHDLCHAQDQIFLIEEPENDLHPQALKKLLDIIIEKSEYNQFFISTHSNIVTKILGSEPDTKIFEVTNVFAKNNISSSKCVELENTQERFNALRNLGYELSDYNLWEAWLILEESSAETFIREYFIKWYTPDLIGKLRTIAADGVNDLEPRFMEFRRLFTFLHLQQEMYLNKAWVIVDGELNGSSVIDKLRKKFVKDGSWLEEQFIKLVQPQFENYYPCRFKSKVEDINSEQDSSQKRELKKTLLKEVLAWVKEDQEVAKKEFEASAEEIVGLLKQIEKKIC